MVKALAMALLLGRGEAMPAAADAQAAAGAPAAAPGGQPTAPAESALQRGLTAYRAGNLTEAAAWLRQAHAADPGDVDVAALLGIVCYKLHRYGEAAPLLRQAAAAADPQVAASARVHLGLIVQAQGEAEAAAPLVAAGLDAVAGAAEPDIARARAALAPARWSLLGAVRPGYDSNVLLLPSTPTAGAAKKADGDLTGWLTARWRPLPQQPLTLENSATYRHQLTIQDRDLFSNTAALEWRTLAAGYHLGARYAFDLLLMGGPLLLLGHTAEVGGGPAWANGVRLGARYQGRHADYRRAEYDPFSGPAHTGWIEGALASADRRRELTLGVAALREVAADPAFSARGGGARVAGRWGGGAVDLSLVGSATRRLFDVRLPGEDVRRDWQYQVEGTAIVPVGQRWALLLGAVALFNESTVAGFRYTKVGAFVGMAGALAGH